MYRCKIFVIVLITTAIISCNKKEDITNSMDNENVQQVNYIINTNLSLEDYSDVKGYFPKEGFVPTAEIAFQIAEPVLNQIYGKETIEEEKPFSINLENDIWVIEGYLAPGFKGGVAYMEIRKSTGEILKVIHTK
ncbi:MAG: YbbC/YhhH family protein [Candidatus Symbiothrix sp.]|jgi:hypothetical protein|nr:YbbC/YhhH family protein [Candidatus Symbiothrix sp.]